MSPQSNDSPNSADEAFVSKLDKGRERFLAHVIENALNIGRRTADDFVRHFPPAAIMKGLELRPHLRAKILEPATGVRRKIALKKSAASAGEDLQIAMDEGEATAEQLVSLLDPDDRVRYLPHKKLWAFVVEGEFWKVPRNSGAEFERAKSHLAFMIDRALEDRLVSHESLVEGVSIDELAESLPRDRLATILKAAINLGRDKKPFTDSDLLESAASTILVQDISLAHLWETTIVPKIALPHEFAESTGDKPAGPDAEEEITTVGKIPQPPADSAAAREPDTASEPARAEAAAAPAETATPTAPAAPAAAAAPAEPAAVAAAKERAKQAKQPAPSAAPLRQPFENQAKKKPVQQAQQPAAPGLPPVPGAKPAGRSAARAQPAGPAPRPENKTDPNIRASNNRDSTGQDSVSGVISGVVGSDEVIEEIEMMDIEDEFGQHQHTQARKP